MPNSLVVGVLRAKDETSITLSGDVRLMLADDVDAKGIDIGQSVTVWIASRHGVLFAYRVRPTPAAFG